MDIEQEHLTEFLTGKWVPTEEYINRYDEDICIYFEDDGRYKYIVCN